MFSVYTPAGHLALELMSFPSILTRLCDLLAVSAAIEVISEVFICCIFFFSSYLKTVFTLVMSLFQWGAMAVSFHYDL